MASLLGVLLLIQLVPYGRNHTNPTTIKEPNWNNQETREIAYRACFSCHSNETEWPWYSYIAPSSWLVQRDVDQARAVFNFSEWDGGAAMVNEMEEALLENKMPPIQYLLLHAEARLSVIEKQQLITGLLNSLP